MLFQKIKKSIFNLLVLAQLVTPITAIASGELHGTRLSAVDEMLVASGNLLIDSISRHSDETSMKWIQGGFRSEASGEYSFDLKAFSVIGEYARQVFFTQYGLSKDGDVSTLNAGLGFYHLLSDNIMIGGNTFYDARTGTEDILNPFGEGVHKRYSIGGTIMTSQAGLFFNVYRGLSDSIAKYKVSDGYDFGINGLVPGLESINLGITKYKFNEETQGSKFKVEYKPNSLFTFGVEQDQSDNPSSSLYDNPSSSLYIETKYEFNKPSEEQSRSTARVGGDVWSKRYNEVERDNKITLELAVVDFTMATPTSVPHGATVDLKPLAIGGGDGGLSFEKVGADADVTVTDAGTVTSLKATEVDVKVTRAALGEYNEATVTVTVIFTKQGVTLVDDAEDNGLLTSEQGRGEGFGVDLTKAIVTVGTGDVSYAIKSDEEEEDESKMASSPMVNHTGKAVPASHPLGASVTEKGLVTATGVGTVGVVVSQKGDSNYEASVLDVYVTFSKSSKGIEVEVPKSVEWGKTVDLKPLISGGGEGKLSFNIKEGAENTIDANVTQDDGIVTAVSAGTIEVTVKREEDSNYEVSTQDVTVTFGRKTEDLIVKELEAYTGAAFTITGVTGAGSNETNLTYEKLETLPEDMGTVEVNLDTGDITGVVNPGVVKVTAIRKQDNKYNRVTAIVIINFVDEPEKLTIEDQEATWGEPEGFDLGALVTGGQGALSFEKSDNDAEMDAELNSDTGVIKAKEAGVLTVTVTRGGEEVEVTVTFNAQDGTIDASVPNAVIWGNPAQINVTGNGLNTLKYEMVRDSSIESADVGISSGILTADEGGVAVVNITREGNKDYNTVSETFTFTFDRKTEDLVVADLTAFAGATFTITDVTGAGSNETNLRYEKLETLPEDMGTVEVNPTTGDITGVESPGVVKVTAIRKQDDSYNRVTATVTIEFVEEPEELTIEDQETIWGKPDGFDLRALVTGGQGTFSFAKSGKDAAMEAEINSETGVINAEEAGILTVVVTRGDEEKEVKVTFLPQDGTIEASVAKAAIWGDEAQIIVTGNGPDALTYNMVKESSIESAEVGISTGILTADEGGVAVVEITREGNKDYNTVSETLTFTFGKQTSTIIVQNPDTVAFGTPSQISVTGVGGQSFKYKMNAEKTKIDAEVNLDSGLVESTEPGIAFVVVTHEGNDSYIEKTQEVQVNFGEALIVDDQEAIWGVPEGFDLGARVNVGEGTLSFAKSGNDVGMKADLNSETGVINAKEVGVLTVMVTRGVSNVEVNVTFKARDGTINPTVSDTVWGSESRIHVDGEGQDIFEYLMVEDVSIESADVDRYTGVVTADEGGVAVVKIRRIGNENYKTVSQDVDVTFSRKTEPLTGLTDVRTSPINTSYTIDGIIGTDISDGDLKYVLKSTDPSNMESVLVNPTTGEITGVETKGEVTVTVTRKGNASYEQVSGDVTITYFDGGTLFVTDQNVLDAQIWHDTDTFNLADYIAGGGELSFTGAESNNAAKDIQVTPTGMITARDAGTFKVNVHRAQKDGYSVYDLEVSVIFGKQASTINVQKPDTVKFGIPSQINVTGIGGPSFTYMINKERTKIDAEVNLNTGLVESTELGTAFVVVTHVGTENYSQIAEEVEVNFKGERTTVNFILNNPGEIESGEAVEVSKLVHMPEGVETGTLSYAIEVPNNIGAELNENTGHLTATGSGPVRIVVTREEDNRYNMSSQFIDIVFAFSGEDSKARLSLGYEVVLTQTMKVNFYGDEVAGYKQIRSYDIVKLQGYEDYGQSWHISSSGHKDWNLQLNNQELVREQKAQIAGEAVFPNCSYGTVKQTWKGGLNVHEDYIYVKDGARCTFDVTFFRKGNYKGKTVKVDFLAADIARARSNGYMTPRVKLDDTAETRSTGTKVFRKMNLASADKLRNPDSQELIYTGSDFSFQPNGSLWEESHLTDDFLEGLEQNCVVASGNIIYVREHTVCYGHVRFVESTNYLSKSVEFDAKSRQNYNTSTFGNKFKFIGSSEFPGAEEVTGVYGVNVKTAFNGSQLDNIPYTLSGPDVETREDGSAVHWDSRGTVINKINNVEKCIFVRSKNSSSYNDRLLLIKKGVTCNITVNFPSTTYAPEKTEHITVTAKGLSPNPASIGNLSYTAQWEAEDDSFKYVELLDLERNNGFYIHTNNPNTIFTRNDYRYRLALGAIDYSGAQLHSDSGKPFPNGTTLDSLGKNCMIISSDSNNEGNPPVFYVKKGTSCAIDVTFPENDNYLEKTETLTLSANDD